MKQYCLKYHLSFLPLLLFFSLSTSVAAQSSDFTALRQQRALLPNHVKSISCLDTNIYFYAASPVDGAPGVLLKGYSADTVFVKLDENVDYVVRHPSTGDLYFTTLDNKGRSYLYRCWVEESGKQKVKQVKMDGGFFSKGMNVYHPTFSANGEVMVFSSSREDRNKGSLDLWYSRFNGEEWSDPVNLGHRINTSGDEITPFVYNGCLIFASNGDPDDHGRYSLYATKLFSGASPKDTTGRQQIGRCLVQRLPAPFNIVGTDNFGLSFDSRHHCGYWISNRDDANGHQLYSFSGTLEGMLLWGTVTDKYDHPLPGVRIDASQHGNILCSTTTDASGRYQIYLHCGRLYELSYRLDNYFVTTEPVNALQGEEGYLITEQQHNVKLYGLPVGQRFSYDDLFGPDADVELSARGKEELKPLVQFLTDNPTKRLTLSLSNDLTEDPSFNSLLTDRRILSLEKHLREALPETVEINIFNSCDGKVKCSTGTGISSLTILIDK